MVIGSRTTEMINEYIKLQALYHSSTEEIGRTEGKGFCSILLALAGIIDPQLNSRRVIKLRKEGRDDIANVIDTIMIPSTQKYIQPAESYINQRTCTWTKNSQ